MLPTCLVASPHHVAHGIANREDVLIQPPFALAIDPRVQLLTRLGEGAEVVFIGYLRLRVQAATAAATPGAAVQAAAEAAAAATTIAWANSKATAGVRSRSIRAQHWRQ